MTGLYWNENQQWWRLLILYSVCTLACDKQSEVKQAWKFASYLGCNLLCYKFCTIHCNVYYYYLFDYFLQSWDQLEKNQATKSLITFYPFLNFFFLHYLIPVIIIKYAMSIFISLNNRSNEITKILLLQIVKEYLKIGFLSTHFLPYIVE